MRIVNLLILFFVISVTTQAQDRFIKGYYVSTKNDTAHGMIGYRDTYSRYLTFKTDIKAPKQSLGQVEVKSFTFENGQTFELVNFADKNSPSDLTYARKIGGDVISLYYSHSQFLIGSDEKSYFVIKKDKSSNSDEATSRHQKKVGAFNVLFNDCPEVRDEANKSVVSEEQLLKRLEEYHRCKSVPYKSYIPTNRRRIHFGAFVGGSMSGLSFSGEEHLEGTSFSKSNKPLYGLMMTVTPSKKASSIFSMQLELLYTSMYFEGTFSTQRQYSGYNIQINSSTIVESQIIMPRFGVRLTGRSNVLNPYISFGVSVPNIVTSESYDVKTVAINDGSETTESFNTIEIDDFGVWAGVGLKRDLGKERALFADVILNNMGVSPNGRVMMITPRLGFIF